MLDATSCPPDGRAVGDVAPVGEDVHADALGAALHRAADDGKHLVGAAGRGRERERGGGWVAEPSCWSTGGGGAASLRPPRPAASNQNTRPPTQPPTHRFTNPPHTPHPTQHGQTHRECTPPSDSRPMRWRVWPEKAGVMYFQPCTGTPHVHTRTRVRESTGQGRWPGALPAHPPTQGACQCQPPRHTKQACRAHVAGEHGPRLKERVVHQSGALGDDLTSSQRIVPHLAVAHVVVWGGGGAGGWVGNWLPPPHTTCTPPCPSARAPAR